MWRPDPLAAVGEAPQPIRLARKPQLALALPRDALLGASGGAPVHPAERKEVLDAFRRGDADGGTERVGGHPLAAEVPGEELAQVAAHRVAVFVVPLEARNQVVDEQQLVPAPGQPDPVLA